MTPLALLIQAAFYLVFVATVWQYVRTRGELELRVAAVFATTAALFAISFLAQVDPDLTDLVRSVGIVALLAQPFLVAWLIDLVSPLRRGVIPALFVVFLAIAGAYLAFGARNVPTLVAIMLYFGLVETAAAARLIRDGRRRYGLPRFRLALAGVATLLFALAIVISAAGSIARGEGPQSELVTTASRLAALFAGLGYLAAFAPPLWLRRMTQRAIAFDLSRSLVARPTGTDPVALWQELATAARDVLGATRVRVLGAEGGAPLAEVGAETLDRTSVVEVPIMLEQRGAGRLVAEITGRPLFVDDDLAILQHLGSLTTHAVEREEAIVALAHAGRELRDSAAVRASEARFRALLDANPSAILALDGEGRISWATRRAAELFGYPWDELVGMEFARLVSNHEPSSRNGEGERSLLRAQAVAHRMDGTTFPAELALSDAQLDGQPVQLAVVGDATWRQEADQLRERFLGVLSHELRTPVTSIYGGTQLMLSRGDRLDEETRHDLLTGVAAESERLQRMIENLLVLARIERGGDFSGPRPVLLDRALRSLLERERALAAEATITLEIPRPLPMVGADEEYLAQILRNLLSNAVKYAGAGASIQVEALPGDEEVLVRVYDDGPGIAAEEAERVFSLYFRSAASASSTPGAGIGLFVCRELVAAMGGRIWARPRPEGGSEFGFSLPVYAEDPELEEPATRTASATRAEVAVAPMLAQP